MPIFGWDASDYDWGRGPMDVAAAVRDGIVFFTHKATEGTRTQHAHYGEALNRARAAGMPLMGPYMVPRTPGNNGHGTIAQQVDYFLAYLDAQTPWWRGMREFFLQVDTEHWGYDDVAPQFGAQACALLRAQTGKWVIHYAPRWAYGDTIPGDEPLWASSYGNNPAVPYRQAYPGDNSSGWAPYSGRTPVFLQYGSRLTVGSQPGCDVNAYRGSLDELRALVTGGITTMASPLDDPNFNAHFMALIFRVAAIMNVSDTVEGGPTAGQGAELSKLIKRIDVNAAAAASKPAATVAMTDADRQAIIDGVTAKLAALIPTAAQIATAAADEEAKRLSNG